MTRVICVLTLFLLHLGCGVAVLRAGVVASPT